jgi:hypothetical protein
MTAKLKDKRTSINTMQGKNQALSSPPLFFLIGNYLKDAELTENFPILNIR